MFGVRVNADQTRDLDSDPGFFFDLAHDSLRYGFTDFLRSSWNSIEIVVSASDHQQPTG